MKDVVRSARFEQTYESTDVTKLDYLRSRVS